jgi:hypothetical protein
VGEPGLSDAANPIIGQNALTRHPLVGYGRYRGLREVVTQLRKRGIEGGNFRNSVSKKLLGGDG